MELTTSYKCRGSTFFLMACFVISYAAPMPPRSPYNHYSLERYSQRLHLKEDSPIYCSRAVSRWVRDAWNIVISDAFKQQKVSHETMNFGCPFYFDVYSKHENSKESHGTHGSHLCGECLKSFKSEYHLDRHLDRRHSFQDFILPDDYKGGPVTKIIDLKSNQTVDIDPKSSKLARWGTCLEDYCQIFDVCDRPFSRRYPLIHSNNSITHPSHFNITVNSERPVDGACNEKMLPSIHEQCYALVNSCFSLEPFSTVTRRANIYIKKHLCGALHNCSRYVTRRQYAGSPKKFTEAGTLTLPVSAMTGWKVALIVIGVVVLVLIVIAGICYCLGSEDVRYRETRSSDAKSTAYKSAMEHISPAARRRLIGPVDSFQYPQTLSRATVVPSQPSLVQSVQMQPMQQQQQQQPQQHRTSGGWTSRNPPPCESPSSWTPSTATATTTPNRHPIQSPTGQHLHQR